MTEIAPTVPYEAIDELAITATGFVFDPRTGKSFSANETGLAAIRAFREGLDLFEAKARLAADFCTTGDAVESGLNSFLRQLNRHLA